MKKIILIFGTIFFIFLYLNIKSGYISISFTELYHYLIGELKDSSIKLILDIRFNKTITAILLGLSLPISGFLLQELFKNPLASPSILGISSASSLGVALFIFLGLDLFFIELPHLQNWLVVLFSILGSVICMAILLLVAKRIYNSSSFIIVGFLFSAFSGAIISILQFASESDKIKQYLIWSLGSFSAISNQQLFIYLIFVTLGLFLAFGSIHSLKGLMLGNQYALSLGIHPKKVHFIIIMSTSILVGGSTAFIGPISFIGIIVPHFCRNIYSPVKLWNQFTLNLIIGATLMLVFLFISEKLKIPINIIAVLLGIPTLFTIIFNKKNSFVG